MIGIGHNLPAHFHHCRTQQPIVELVAAWQFLDDSLVFDKVRLQ
jgi:hypothetical protein